jgi:hypothetical protein
VRRDEGDGIAVILDGEDEVPPRAPAGPTLSSSVARRLLADLLLLLVESSHRRWSFSALKSEHHDPVKLGQIERFGDKGERTVDESFFLRLRERTP